MGDSPQSSSGFNPGSGFRSVATGNLAQIAYLIGVSIPVRVFDPSRPSGPPHNPLPPHSFNPGSGFRSVATPGPAAARNAPEFQSRFGFSIRRDTRREVSDMCSNGFQSRFGFSIRRDRLSHSNQPSTRRFQSRFGFSIRRDCTTLRRQFRVRRVSIPVRVFDPSRRSRTRERDTGKSVSIPVRVFDPSRRGLADKVVPGWGSFNPGSGFRSVATNGTRRQELRSNSFQSRFGFSIRRDPLRSYIRRSPWFQSRFGFSIRRDNAEIEAGDELHMFQSRFGFSIRRDSRKNQSYAHTYKTFQSRFGFSIRRDVGRRIARGRTRTFQSRFGFSIRRDEWDTTPVATFKFVSIPVRVFDPSRLPKATPASSRTYSFNPGSGFRSVATDLAAD